MPIRSQVLGFAAEVQDRASSQLGRLDQSYGRLRHSAQRTSQMITHSQGVINSFGEALGAIGLVSFAKRITGYWEAAAKSAEDYQKAQTDLQFILTKTKTEMQSVREATLDISKASLYTATEITRAWYELASAGLAGSVSFIENGKKVREELSKMALESTLRFATMAGGEVKLADAAAFAGALVLKSGIDLSKVNWDEQGKRITLLDRAMDMLAQTTRLTRFHMKDFPAAFNSMRTAMQGLNMDLETTLAITGALMSGGMSPREAGNALSALARKIGEFASRPLMDQLYEKVYSGIPPSRGRRGRGMGGVGGTRERLRQTRLWYFIENIFGSKEAFQQALTDAKGNVGNMLTFMSRIESGLEAKYGKGGEGFKKLGALQKLFGDIIPRQMFQALEKIRITLPKDIYQVDEWGKAVERNGQRTLLFAKDIEYTGFTALAALVAANRDSANAAKQYEEMMAQTTWGLKKLRDSAKETFKILIGEHVLPIINRFLTSMRNMFLSISEFARAFPTMTKLIVYVGLLVTGIVVLAAAISVLVVAWGFMRVNLGHFIRQSKEVILAMLGIAQATAAAAAAQTAYNVSVKGSALGLPRPYARGAETIAETAAGQGIAWRLGNLINRFGGIARVLLYITLLLGIAKGLTGLWEENTWGVKNAVDKVGKSSWDWLTKIGEKIKWFYNVIKFIGVVLSGNMWMPHEIWTAVGNETAMEILSFFRDNTVGRTIDKIAMSIGKIVDSLDRLMGAFEAAKGLANMALIGAGAGGLIGFLLFGPAGMVAGAAIGILIAMIITASINLYKNWDKFKKQDWVQGIVKSFREWANWIKYIVKELSMFFANIAAKFDWLSMKIHGGLSYLPGEAGRGHEFLYRRATVEYLKDLIAAGKLNQFTALGGDFGKVARAIVGSNAITEGGTVGGKRVIYIDMGKIDLINKDALQWYIMQIFKQAGFSDSSDVIWRAQ